MAASFRRSDFDDFLECSAVIDARHRLPVCEGEAVVARAQEQLPVMMFVVVVLKARDDLRAGRDKIEQFAAGGRGRTGGSQERRKCEAQAERTRTNTHNALPSLRGDRSWGLLGYIGRKVNSSWNYTGEYYSGLNETLSRVTNDCSWS